MVTFTIDSSVEILDSYLDERFLLWRALRASICASGFHTCFGPRRALQASIQVLGKFRTLTASAFALGLWRVLWASLRASAGTMSTGCWGRAVSRAGPGTSRGRARRRSCQHATASAGERISSTGLLRGYILQKHNQKFAKSFQMTSPFNRLCTLTWLDPTRIRVPGQPTSKSHGDKTQILPTTARRNLPCSTRNADKKRASLPETQEPLTNADGSPSPIPGATKKWCWCNLQWAMVKPRGEPEAQ